MPKYFIYWKSLLNNYQGHGKEVLTDNPKEYVARLNDIYFGEIVHSYSSDWNSFVKNPNKFYNKL